MFQINVNELVNIYLTGRTCSGKTSLANAFFTLSNESQLLRWKTTGYQDCTEQVSYYQSNNIRVYDLPGIGSCELRENINRASLLIPQIEFDDIDDINNLEVWNYSKYLQTGEIEQDLITVKQWQSIENQKYVAPDVIVYVQRADRQFLFSDRKYLRDLLKSQKQRGIENKVIFVLNIFHNQDNIALATKLNIEDAKEAITRVYQEFYKDIPLLIEADFLQKEGIDKLIFLIQQKLKTKQTTHHYSARPMYFQLTPPSISKIRAKFIIEKLSKFPQNIDDINLFFTGRTGSGKTTLSNRLIGSDYFLSTGHQDCTKEINLIEFPIGLKCFDTPGVCSDELLENYNRVALGINQVEDCPFVENIILAKYRENHPHPQEQNLSVAEFISLRFQPDLIYYLIAPEKQFTRGDRKYLRDLLKRHQNIIYVFNMFVNKQTGISYSATETEAKISDATSQILKVHNNILGENHKPVIVGVNCWTGEGISELLHQSQLMLLGEKGKIFEQLIQYQQQKTPDEYVNQVKRELIRLYAHAACERPTGSDTCDQPLHKICHTLFDFLARLPIQSGQSDNSIYEQVNTIVNQVFSNPSQASQTESLEDKVDYVQRGLNYTLNEGIESFNELIKTYIFDLQKQGHELESQEIEEWKQKKESDEQESESKWNLILSKIEDFNRINNSLESLDQEIENMRGKLKPRIEAHHSRYVDILSRRQSLNSRIDRWKDRLDRYNANIQRINRSSARLTYEAKQSIEQESDYLDREQNSIKSEDSYVDSLVTDWQREDERIEVEKSKFNDRIDNFNQKIQTRDRKRKLIQEQLKEHNEFKKNAQDERNFWFELIKAFEDELNSLGQRVDIRIDEMNVHIQEIKNRLSENYFEQFLSMEDSINELQKVINRCIDEMNVFENQIFTFHQEINACIFKLTINKMVTQVLQKTTEHYFDETGEFEYRGSHYHYFRQHGITLGLALTRMTLLGMEEEYEEFYNELLRKVERLGYFPDHPVESKILSLLESNINSLFDSSFDEVIRQAVL
ncbi:GTPase [Microcoleus sp.]|uniref:GTPase n=1 Tax=Microcoleus sp. TaxID=44472 RepID=UPI0035243126